MKRNSQAVENSENKQQLDRIESNQAEIMAMLRAAHSWLWPQEAPEIGETVEEPAEAEKEIKKDPL